jgi:hypothetical protein
MRAPELDGKVCTVVSPLNLARSRPIHVVTPLRGRAALGSPREAAAPLHLALASPAGDADQQRQLDRVSGTVSRLHGVRSVRAVSIADPIAGIGICVFVELDRATRLSLQEVRAAVGNETADQADLPSRLVLSWHPPSAQPGNLCAAYRSTRTAVRATASAPRTRPTCCASTRAETRRYPGLRYRKSSARQPNRQWPRARWPRCDSIAPARRPDR